MTAISSTSNARATSPRRALIVGDGLTGAFLGVLLARDGWSVRVVERRSDPRAAGYAGGRSINLALSARGLASLREADLERVVMERDAIPMRGRMIHMLEGPGRSREAVFQPYSSDPRDAINSVSRSGLNLTLIHAAAASAGVEMVFDRLCVDVDFAGTAALFRDAKGGLERIEADLIVGADGAFSAVRGAMQKTDRFEYSQSYLGHGYKELHIPAGGEHRLEGASGGGGFALAPHALHIWPRGGAMMIALPNRDGSFTCTLFWPFEGEHSFAGLASGACASEFFAEQYPDAVELMPTLAQDYAQNPTSSLVTVRCEPWSRRGVVLVGDAAHAIVPFYGQGINCGFEDCVALARALATHRDQREALHAYELARKPNADAIADMALDNFVEMRDKTGRPEFRYRKRIEQTLHGAFPERCQPQYNLVSFATVPYTEARARGRELERVIDAVERELPMGTMESLGQAAWEARVRHAGERALHTRGAGAVAKRGTRVDVGTPHKAGSKANTGGAGGTGSAIHAMPRALIDISPPITPALGVWPGDTPFSREMLLDIEQGGNITLSTIRATLHLGSHADGPNHYGRESEGASGVGEMELSRYVGACRVLRARVARGARVRPEDVEGLESLREERVLICTGTFPDATRWNEDFAALSVELIDALAARGVRTIGIDTPSVDLQESKDLPAHRAILRHDIAILEGLVLGSVAPGPYELIALPLRLMECDASPVRAVLRRLGQ